MLIMRPIVAEDFSALYDLACQSGGGMTNLPKDEAALELKLQQSIRTFNLPPEKALTDPESLYIFMLEETEGNKIAGCSGILGLVGMDRPVYSFKLINLPHTSQELNRYKNYSVLQMVNEYTGTAEVGVLFVGKDFRSGGCGKILSRGRYLFMAAFRERFPHTVHSELRGVQFEDGRAVFWNSLGKHFFDMEFSKADYLSAVGNYQFIADLMPKYPVYVCLLPKEAQEVIGVPHASSRAALAMLEREGFRFEGCVDVFDAGPTVHCPIDQVHSVRDSVHARVESIVEDVAGMDCLISTTEVDNFKVARGRLRTTSAGLSLGQEVATALKVDVGDYVRYVYY